MQDGLLVENMFDLPYLKGAQLGPEVVACMTRLCQEVRHATPPALPCGVQVCGGGGGGIRDVCKKKMRQRRLIERATGTFLLSSPYTYLSPSLPLPISYAPSLLFLFPFIPLSLPSNLHPLLPNTHCLSFPFSTSCVSLPFSLTCKQPSKKKKP